MGLSNSDVGITFRLDAAVAPMDRRPLWLQGRNGWGPELHASVLKAEASPFTPGVVAIAYYVHSKASPIELCESQRAPLALPHQHP